MTEAYLFIQDLYEHKRIWQTFSHSFGLKECVANNRLSPKEFISNNNCCMKLITQMNLEFTISSVRHYSQLLRTHKTLSQLRHLLTIFSLPCGSPSVALCLRIKLFAKLPYKHFLFSSHSWLLKIIEEYNLQNLKNINKNINVLYKYVLPCLSEYPKLWAECLYFQMYVKW